MNVFVSTPLLLLAIGSTALASEHTLRGDEPTRSSLPAPVVDADYYDDGSPTKEKVALGRLLFFDKVLSGNQNISCATCHHPRHATTDAIPLPLGEGPHGLGPARQTGLARAEAVHERVPRNSPALFNLGAEEFTRMFHDGRVETDPNEYYEGGFITPARWKLPLGLESVLAAQAMFPVVASVEMAGQKGENGVANASSLNNAAGRNGVWEQVASRLQTNAEYVSMFRRAFPNRVDEATDITYVEAANAIAAFEATAFRADRSPFDDYLRGDDDALSASQKRGMNLFYGEANCASCHSGKFQTDHDFHAIAMPQIGPGKSDGSDASYWRASGEQAFLEDFGRGRVTAHPEDEFKFRTPSLRNVELTAPYGHDGAYESLEAVVRHHLDPVAALEEYDLATLVLPTLGPVLEVAAADASITQSWLGGDRLSGFLMRDTWVQRSPELRGKIARANELAPTALSDDDVADLVVFLRSLTDPRSRDLTGLIPERVPSGLTVED
jgi:cytochrome c peroxidase